MTAQNSAPAPSPPVPLDKQLIALEEEIPHMIKRQQLRAEKGKVHWAVASIRIRELKAALEWVKETRRVQIEGPRA